MSVFFDDKLLTEVTPSMIEEIVSNMYRTEIPLRGSPLKWLNSYIVKGGDRFLIIDTGFNREELSLIHI